MRGRKPKPTGLQILNGNPGHRPLNAQEPQPPRDLPECPPWLDDIAKAKWSQLAPALHAAGVLTLIDGDVLAAYCQAFAEFEIATRTIQNEGRTAESGTGVLKPHPAVQQQRTAWKAVQQFAALLGLDPSSRSRLKIPDAPAADPFSVFLDGAK